MAFGNPGTTGPRGDGFAIVKLAKSGVVAWSVTLSDGRKLTGSFTASPDGDVPLYTLIPYVKGGSFLALLETTIGADLARVVAGGPADAAWIKKGSTSATDRTYRDGFDLDLDARGAEYRVPAAGQLLFGAAAGQALDLTMQYADVDLASAFSGIAAGGEVTRDAVLQAGNKVAVLPPGVTVTASLSLLSGAFTATAALSDTVGGVKIPRTLTLTGLYIPDPDVPSNSEAAGFFLLPQLPAVGESASSKPIQSGVFQLGQ